MRKTFVRVAGLLALGLLVAFVLSISLQEEAEIQTPAAEKAQEKSDLEAITNTSVNPKQPAANDRQNLTKPRYLLKAKLVDDLGNIVKDGYAQYAEQEAYADEQGNIEFAFDSPLNPRGLIRFLAEGYQTKEMHACEQATETCDLGQVILLPQVILQIYVTDALGNPISDVVVDVYEHKENQQAASFHDLPDTTAQTNELGEAEFRPLTSTLINLKLSKWGLLQLEESSLQLAPYPALNRFEFSMQATKAISGIVFNSKRQPLLQASVAAFPSLDMDSASVRIQGRERQAEQWVYSDEHGKFSIQGLTRGKYYLVASLENYVLQEIPNIAPGQEALEIILQKGASIAGRVFSPNQEEPLVDFHVKAVRVGANAEEFNQDPERLQLSTDDADGIGNQSYQIIGLPPGDYYVLAKADGLAEQKSASISLSAGEERQNVDIYLESGKELLVKVIEQKTGSAISGAELQLDVLRAQQSIKVLSVDTWNWPKITESDEQGTGRFAHLPNQTLELTVLADGFMSAQQIVAEFSGSNSLTIELERKESSLPQQIGNTGILKGKCFLAGSPMIGAHIGIFGQDQDLFPLQQQQTTVQGEFVFANLPAGTLVLKVIAKDMFAPYQTMTHLENGEEKTFDLEFSNRSVRGQVSDEATGQGLANANIEVVTVLDEPPASEDGAETVMISQNNGADIFLFAAKKVNSDTQGVFHLNNIPPGKYSLAISAESYIIQIVDIVIPPVGQGAEINVGLQKGTIISGVIKDRQNQRPSSHSEVFLYEENNLIDVSHCNAMGEFRLEAMPPGEYRMRVVSPDYPIYEQKLRIEKAGLAQQIVIEL